MRRSARWALAAMALALPAKAADLTIAVGGAFTSMDPHFFDLSPNHALTWHVFDRLVHPDADQRPSPGLATSWRVVDERTWEFKLREGVRWQDGTPFTADDVVYTFERAPNVPNSPTSMGQYIRPVTRLEVVDAHTIRMHTAEPIPLIPQMMMSFSIIGRKQGEGMSTADYNSGKAAIGTGPYRLVSLALGDRAVFARNPNYWGAAQPWERVTYRMITNDSARVAALQSGDVDAIDTVPTRDVARISRDNRLTVASRPGLRLIYLYVDANRPVSPLVTDRDSKPIPNPMRDVRVRQALSIAINREGIQRQIMEGYSKPTGQAQPEGAMGYDPSIPVPAYEPDRAKRLLAEAGYPDGFNITLSGPNDRYVNDDSIAQAIAQMWARIGVRTQVATTPASVFFTAGGVRDEHSIALTGWSTSTGEPDTHLSLMLATPEPERGRGTRLRPSHYSNTSLDRLIDRALTTIDQEAREKLYFEAIRIGYQQELAVIPIHHQVNIWAMRKGISYTPQLSEQTRAMEFAPAR